jgi:preprotein translocase subunit SecE
MIHPIVGIVVFVLAATIISMAIDGLANWLLYERKSK